MSGEELQRLARRIAGGDVGAARRALVILEGRSDPRVRLVLSGFLGHVDEDDRFYEEPGLRSPWDPDHSKRIELGPYLRVRFDAHPARTDRIGGPFARAEALIRDDEGDDEERWGDAMEPGGDDEPGASWRPVAWLDPHGWRAYSSVSYFLRLEIVEG